jgi:arginine repressor
VRWQEIAGTLAGEDTILVIPKVRTAARGLATRLEALIVSRAR